MVICRVTFDEEMRSYCNTDKIVYHIEAGKLDESKLVFAEDNALMLTNWDKEIIDGSTYSDYVGGVGTEVRFKIIKEFIQLDNETVIVTDFFSHCLREVKRSTRRTSPFAGTCSASFCKPISMILAMDCWWRQVEIRR